MAAAACTDASNSATDLHPEGPPMIEQVLMTDVITVAGSTPFERTVFAFGTHADAPESDVHPATAAKATGNKLRIVIDELLRGNNLEEIECRGIVDNDVYARVPIGDTPDDIAHCTVAKDVLPRTCPGSNPRSLCICQNDGGCVDSSGSALIAKGESVGVQDRDNDGAADHTRFIDGAVGIACGTDTVKIDLVQSYWNPSGNQQKPAEGGFNALGPAIVLVPSDSLPTSSECGLVFASDVVDKDDNAVCAPPDGDIAQGCSPGDTSAFRFTTEALKFSGAAPARLADPVQIVANAALLPESIVNITMTEGDPGTPFTQFTATVTSTGTGTLRRTIEIRGMPMLAASTRYTITLPTTVTDAYRKSAPEPFVFSFTTPST